LKELLMEVKIEVHLCEELALFAGKGLDNTGVAAAFPDIAKGDFFEMGKDNDGQTIVAECIKRTWSHEIGVRILKITLKHST
jgi:hypothetical protein